eukprot:13144280-Ditylum_brightwellii.AAC.1
MNQEICALCDRLWDAGYWDTNLLHYITNKYLQSSCEVVHVWAITHVSEETTIYLNANNNFHEDEIDESTIVTYTQLHDETSNKYEEMLGSSMWTPKVPSKKQQNEPDLSTAGLQAAIEKAVHASLQKIGSKSKQSRSQSFRKQSFSDNEHCNHCNEKDHKRETCPHKK